MMKKKLYNIFMLLVGVVSFAACTPEVDDAFDQSAAERVEMKMKECREVLTSAPNGWRMEYYAARTYGGYNVLCKFEGDNVTVASEKAGSTQNAGVGSDGKVITATSHFSIIQSQGVLLSFDEYNDVFHYFSDPKNPDYGVAGEGMEGDFEFRVVSATPEKVELVGKKHESRIVMYPIEEGKAWETVMAEIAATEDFMKSRSYQFVVDGVEETVDVTSNYRSLIFSYTDEKGENHRVAAPFIITKDGYKMYRTLRMSGVDISMIERGTTDEYFNISGVPGARLYTYVPTLKEALETGMWFITYEDLSSFAKPAWGKMREHLKTAGPNNTKNRLYWALIGTYTNKIGFHMLAGNDNVRWGLNIKALNEAEDEVEITSKPADANNIGKTYFNKYGLKGALEPFMGTRGRKFKLSSDSERHPSYIILTDMDEPTNVIKLWEEQKNYPYGDLDADKD